MRYLDIAVALLVGTSAISGLVVLNPGPGDTASRHYRTQIALRDGTLRFLQRVGLPWFLGTPPSQICDELAELSNSTYGIQAEVGLTSCGSPAPPGSDVASSSFEVGGTEVTLEAWSSAAG